MANQETRYDDMNQDEQHRRETYRARRPHASRGRSRSRKPAFPGGIRQRRNKHWNW